MIRPGAWLPLAFCCFCGTAASGQEAPAIAETPVGVAEPVEAVEPAEPAEPSETRVPPVSVVPSGAMPAETVSSSGRFRILGGDSLVRGALAVEAEDVRSGLLRLTGGKEAEKVAVFVVLHGKEGDPMKARSVAVRQVIRDVGFDLEVHVHLSHGVDMEAFRHAVTTALVCAQATNAEEPPPEDARLVVPPWLVEGLGEAAAWREDRPDRKLYEALYRYGGLYKPGELFALDENGYEDLDGAMRAAFRASSGALVMAMSEQPLGQQGLAAFLTEIPTFQGETPALLRRYFPEMNLSETSLAKWLALKLADLAAPSVTEALSVRETDAALTRALMLNLHDGAGGLSAIPIDRWEELSELAPRERSDAVRQAQDSLVRLSYRCFPSYRPLLLDYQTALADIARGKTRGTTEMLVVLGKKRADMLARCERAADVLDWFEITRARETSGAFEDYRRLKARLAEAPTTRDDPLTVYLDRMNRLFARKEIRPLSQLPPGLGAQPVPAGWDDAPELPGYLPRHLPIDDMTPDSIPEPPPLDGPGGFPAR